MKLATFEDDRILDQLNFHFQLVENKVVAMQKELEHQKALFQELQVRFEALSERHEHQSESLRLLRQENKVLKSENKQLVEKEESFKEKIHNLKELSIIVKNPKNATALSAINDKLDKYIRYIDDTVALLETL